MTATAATSPDLLAADWPWPDVALIVLFVSVLTLWGVVHVRTVDARRRRDEVRRVAERAAEFDRRAREGR